MKALMVLNDETAKKVIDNYKNEIDKLKKERNRFLVIAYKAIVLGQLDEIYDKERLLEELGCSEEEYEEIMG